MTAGANETDFAALMKKSLLELRALRARLRELESAGRQPIALIGMGCRFPGEAEDPEKLWRLLRDGGDAIVETPPERWDKEAYYDPDPATPGKTYSRHGGFLRRVDGFDPHFFGISPREAASLDPQQRLLLEVAWEALEDAGQAPDRLYGSGAGVFVGISSFEFASVMIRSLDPKDIDPYFGTGSALSAAPGRLSFIFGLTGPCMAVDTACSSSLVALHLACQSLRRGECDLALAGGVNLMMAPEVNIAFSKARLLAADGRCKTFDAEADGYVRGEGCGVVVLKRLSDALTGGDRVQALIRGSAVNQDGPSGALVVPNGRSQQAVIRQALENAGVSPEELDYVEAHGTGTSLGDPIEVGALGHVFGGDRGPDQPLVIGSVKTNLGHLESAAGMAGLIKVVLCLQHEVIAPHLHYRRPNPQIPWDLVPTVIPTEPMPWPRGERPRLAGLSSFGFTGTNAHVILEEAPVPEPAAPGPERPLHLLTLSARNEQALRALAARFRDRLAAAPEPCAADLCYSANTGRARFRQRLAVVAASAAELRDKLADFAAGRETAGVFHGDTRKTAKATTTFLFTAGGARLREIGRQLYDTHPEFRRDLDRCDEILRRHQQNPLLEVLFPGPGAESPPDEAVDNQPALFALEIALARLWQSWGIRPAAVLGLGAGEYAAACFAGVFSLEDGLELIVRRARLGQQPTRSGEPTRGDEPGPVLAELVSAAGRVSFSPPRIRLIKDSSGEAAGAEIATPGYWIERAQQPETAVALESLPRMKLGTLVVIGPRPIPEAAGDSVADGPWVSGLRQGRSDWRQLLDGLGLLAARGAAVDWSAFDRPYRRRRIALPTYPFQRQRFWLEPSRGEPAGDLFYRIDWRPLEGKRPPGDPAPGAPAGSWLILADAGGIGRELADRLRDRGEQCVLAFPGQEYRQVADREVAIDPGAPADYARFVRESLASRAPLRGAVHLWGLDGAVADRLTPEELESAAVLGCRGALHLVQALAASEFSEPPELWLATRGAQPVGSGTGLPGIAQASLWGLGRVIAAELPQLRCMLVDLDPTGAEQAGLLFAELRRGTAEGREDIAFRDGRRHVARLVRSPAPAPPPVDLRSDRSYLITGGLGEIGLQIACWMLERGAGSLVLLGRSAPSRAAARVLEERSHLGGRVEVIRADVSRVDQLAAALERIRTSMPPLAGVIHCAGTVKDSMLDQHRWAFFAEVFAPKVDGAWNLHRLTRDMPLDFFVLFSSATSLLPSPGTANYVAANTFLDALACHRRRQGLPALSIDWGPWSGLGMARRVGRSRQSQWRAHGIEPLAPPQALEILGRLLGESGQIGAFSVRWPDLMRLFSGMPVPPFLEQLAGEVAREEPAESLVFRQLLAMEPDRRQSFLETYLAQRIAEVLQTEADRLVEVENLAEAGVDSLMIMDLMIRLRDDLRFVLYPREFYQRPTIEGLARYLAAEFERAHGSSAGEPPATAAAATAAARLISPLLREQAQGELFGLTATADAGGEDPLPGIGFVLSSPRSGSTLLRVMLAGHPALFSPPELHLLPFQTMDQRQRLLGESHLGEGLQRALMALLDLDAEASGTMIAGWLEEDLSIRQVYGALQDHAGGRLLIDKSPSYAAHRGVLGRAEQLFTGARYIHLVRHPYAVIESFVRLRMDKLLGLGDRDPKALAEELWTAANRNLLETLGAAAPERLHRVYFEELVRDPATVLAGCCEFLGVPFDDAVLRPYEGDRMTDGVHPASAPIDDPNFRGRDRVEARLGRAWEQIDLGHRLGGQTRALAAELGYSLPRDPVPAPPSVAERPSACAPATREWEMRESFLETRRGLRLCVCEWGPETGSPILLLHGILEQGAAWTEVAQPLAGKGLRVVAPDLRGHGRSDHVGRGGSYHLIDFLADLDAVAAGLAGRPFTLAGHSMGSVLAALFAAARPQAVGSLVLVEPLLPGHPSGEGSGVRELLASQLDILAATPVHPSLPDAAAAAARMRRVMPGLSEAMALKLAVRHTAAGKEGLEWRWDPLLRTRAGIAFDQGPFGRARYLELLERVRPPLTLVFGDASDMRRQGDRLEEEASLPGVRTVTLPGGHNLHFDAPLALAGILAEAALV